MKSKTLVIFFPEKNSKEVSIEKLIKKNFKDFCKFFPTYINIYYVIDENTYVGNDTFYGGYKKSGQSWNHINTVIKADFCIGNTHKYTFNNYFRNPIRDFTKDKTQIILSFPGYCPKSYICKSMQDIYKNIHKLDGEIKVIKPISGQNGIGIQFIKNIKELKNTEFPCVLQEYINTLQQQRVGDYRVVLLNGKIIGKVLRTGKVGSKVANVYQGGSIKNMWNFPIPEQIFHITQEVDNHLSKKYPIRYYSIDFGIDTHTKKPYIFELNSAPAVNTLGIRKKLTEYILKTYLI